MNRDHLRPSRCTSALPFVLLLTTTAALRAQPTFTTIIVQDQVPLDLPPRAENMASEGTVFITRACLSAAGRERLRRGLGFREQFTVEPDAPGPVILSGNKLVRIPGDRRLRGELYDIGLRVLGLGATAEECIAATRDEPLPRAIVVGAAPDAVPPPGYERVGAAESRPVLWTLNVRVQHEQVDATRRAFTILDDWPWTDARHSEWMAHRRDEQPLPQTFPQPLRGIATDPSGRVYWSFTNRLVRTAADGKLLEVVPVEGRHGDLTWHEQRLFAVVSDEGGKISWIQVYDDARLERSERHELAECPHGVGGLCWGDGRFVVAALPADATSDVVVHEYDGGFRHLRAVRLPDEQRGVALRTAAFAYGRFWFGSEGKTGLHLASPDLRHFINGDFDASTGLADAGFGWMFLARSLPAKNGHGGRKDLICPAYTR